MAISNSELEKMSLGQIRELEQKLIREVSTQDNKQMAAKIFTNSLYGATGNQYFRYYDIDLAEAVTITGQVIIQTLEEKLNKFLNDTIKTKNVQFIIAGDTDSVYLSLEKIVQEFLPGETDMKKIANFLDTFSKQQIEPKINEILISIGEYFNCSDNILAMKRESIANKGIWTGKKRYLLNIIDSEGIRYEKPKLKIAGLEAVKSSTPSACREKIKEAINLILNKDQEQLIEFIEKFRKQFNTLPFQDIAFPRGVKGMGKYSSKLNIYEKATPIHVRGSLVYNHHLRQKKLTNKYELIQNGDKIRFMYVKLPNKLGENIIACPGQLPKEFDIHEKLDFDTQFEKAFLEPLQAITNVIGWKTKEEVSLDSFFD